MTKDCRFAKKCPNCGKVRHIKRACRMKAVPVGKEKSRHVQGERGKHDRRANFIQEESGVSYNEEVFTMYHMKASDMTMYNINEEIAIPREEPIKVS